jgi:small-conductance mechanosensitive channel
MTFDDFSNLITRTLFRVGQVEISFSLLIQFVLTLVLIALVAKFTRRLLRERILTRTRFDEGLRYVIARVAGYIVWVIGLMIGLSALGIDLTSLTVLAGALGVGIGFGLQTIVNNLVSGLILLGERSIALGDRDEVGGEAGRVMRIGARSTSVLTNDNIVIIVPNSDFINGQVINWSHAGDTRVRLRLEIGVSYGSDPHLVSKLILEAAAEEPSVLKDPEPNVTFKGFGESSLDFQLRAWTTELTHRPGVFRSHLYFRVWDKFKAHGVEIPFPQRDLHVKEPVRVQLADATATPSASRS